MLTINLKNLLYLEIFLSLAKPVPNDSVVVNKTKKPLIYAKVGNVTHAIVFHFMLGLSVMAILATKQYSEHILQLWRSQRSLMCNYFLQCILV